MYVVAMAIAEYANRIVVYAISTDIVEVSTNFDAVGVVFDMVESNVAEDAAVVYPSQVI